MYIKPLLDQSRRSPLSFTAMLLFLALYAPQAMAGGAIKCWQNRENIRECSKVVPPEYAQQRIEIVNEHGAVVKVIPAARTEAEREEDARQAKLKHTQEERQKQDQLLLRSYAAENDLINTRDKQLTSIQAMVDVAKGKGKNLMTHLRQLQKEAANYERAGEGVPQKLIDDIKKLNRQIILNNKYQEKKQQEMWLLHKKYQADQERYRILRQGRTSPR